MHVFGFFFPAINYFCISWNINEMHLGASLWLLFCSTSSRWRCRISSWLSCFLHACLHRVLIWSGFQKNQWKITWFDDILSQNLKKKQNKTYAEKNTSDVGFVFNISRYVQFFTMVLIFYICSSQQRNAQRMSYSLKRQDRNGEFYLSSWFVITTKIACSTNCCFQCQ